MANLEEYEFRPANDNEMAQVIRLGNYVFSESPLEDAPPHPLRPEWSQCAFHGRNLAAISGAYPFVVCLNGKKARLQGVTLVGTEPAYRRRGLVRRLITDLLHRGKADGEVASILLASRGAIYQRFGYGLASTGTAYEFDPREAVLREAFNDSGYLQRMGKQEAYPLITAIFKSYVKERNLMALRDESIWNRFLADVEKEKAHCLVHFDDAHQADGYCLYRTTQIQGANQTMDILDFAYTSLTAYKSLWHSLTSHDLVLTIKWFDAPQDDPAPGLLLEPRCLKPRTRDGMWMRVIDVAGMLAARRYDVDGDISIAIKDDEICPWNNGTYQVTVRKGEAKVSSGDSIDETAQIVCSINAFASMVSGHARPTWLHQIGLVQVADASDLARHDQLFATRYRPAMSFGF
ncbi:MAG: GNAT family N-acetyltransferase [Gammaproteobacteria bacterium]|nr:GNAT family N-acetyltransferase [Gammaproteobacteria bacterium]